MKKKLEELTVNQFIDLACGDMNVLIGKHEVVSDSRLAETARDIVLEYKGIVDPAGIKSYLSSAEDLVKAKISVVIFKMCRNLIDLNEHDSVREVLIEYGINAASMNDKRVAAEVKSRLERARSTVRKIEDENSRDESEKFDIRREFDAQTAALMAHFKFQIDTSSMKASIYAQLIARHNREIKAQIAAINTRR